MLPIAALATQAAGGGMQGMLTSVSNSFNQLNAAVSQITNTLTKFVGLIDPSLVQNLNLAFRDLNAVIGTALQPALAQMIPVVRGFADALLPVMRQVAPVIASVSKTIAATLQPVLDSMTDAMLVLIPVLELMGEYWKLIATSASVFLKLTAAVIQFIAIALKPITDAITSAMGIVLDLVRVLSVVAEVLAELARQAGAWIASLFGTGMKSTIKDFQSSLREMIKQIIMATAMLFKFMGWNNMLDALIRGVSNRAKERENTTGMAVAQNPTFKAIESLSRDLMTQAFIASAAGGEPERKTDDFLATMEGDLKAIKDGVDIQSIATLINDLPAKIGIKFAEALERVKGAVYEGGKQGAGKVGSGFVRGVATIGRSIVGG